LWTEEKYYFKISKMKNSPANHDKTHKYQAVLPREKEKEEREKRR
jgi:hypothetical protein